MEEQIFNYIQETVAAGVIFLRRLRNHWLSPVQRGENPISPRCPNCIFHQSQWQILELRHCRSAHRLRSPGKGTAQNQTLDELLARHQKLANRFFHSAETAFVSRDCRHNFLTVWIAREAYVKHTGQGIDSHFSEHCVVPEKEAEQARISGSKTGIRWSAMGKHFWKSHFDGDDTLCVCTDTVCACSVIASIEDQA